MAHGRGRKRVLAIVAGILVARHLKTADDLFDSKPSPRTESMVAAAVRWAERIMKKLMTCFRRRPEVLVRRALESPALPLRSRERRIRSFRYRKP